MCYLSGLREEPRKVVRKIDEYKIQVIADNGSGLDSCVILNILSNW